MKTVIKISELNSIEVIPCKAGGVILEIVYTFQNGTKSRECLHLQSDKAGALVFAIEEAEAFSFANKG